MLVVYTTFVKDKRANIAGGNNLDTSCPVSLLRLQSRLTAYAHILDIGGGFRNHFFPQYNKPDVGAALIHRERVL